MEQAARVISAAAKVGIKKIRFTGGEPLVRKNISELIAQTAATEGIDDISLTTNGMKFAEMADELKQAGLNRVNISLDTLDEEKFEYITRRKGFAQIKKAIEKALEYDFSPVKINVVAIKGFNDNEILDFADLSVRYPLNIRFIEFMPIGLLPFYKETRTLSIGEIQRTIETRYTMHPEQNIKGYGPSDNYSIEGAHGTIGFISAMSNHFCGSCNRLRLTADGKLRPCLHSNLEVDLKMQLNNNCSDEKLEELFKKAINTKPFRHHMVEDGWGSQNLRKMSQIGG